MNIIHITTDKIILYVNLSCRKNDEIKTRLKATVPIGLINHMVKVILPSP
jgi:hypothetical protein